MNAPRDDAWLIALGAAISDGRAVDWDAADRRAADPDTRQVLDGLRAVARLIDAHRSTAGPGAAPAAEPARHWQHLVLLDRLGAGAFGTVYRAWDTRLDREVAVKLLPADRSARQSPRDEARLLARVRHPNIVVVHGADEAEGQVAIWMELIEGETLGALVRQRGPMSAREVAGIGIDLCRAISALHGAGLVHRDIKAHNVMRETGGRIVLMDFSGARAVSTAPRADDLSGTPLYMAPELLAGEPATPASDIYAVGVLLFYLLSGRHPVEGASLAELERAHRDGLRRRLRDLRPELPDVVVQVVEKATAADRGARYGTAGDLEHALAAVLGTTAPAPDGRRHAKAAAGRWVAAAALLAIGAAAAGAVTWTRAAGSPPSELVRFTIGPPYNAGSWPRISPDGQVVVFGAFHEGRVVLSVRELGGLQVRPLPGAESHETAFWSADSRSIGFFADGKLKVIDVEEGAIRTIADAPRPRGGDWNRDGVLLFAPEPTGIVRVDAHGGAPAPVTRLDEAADEYEHAWPEFLPDGRRFLYVTRTRGAGAGGVYLASLDAPGRKLIMPGHSRVAYSPSGHLLFASGGTLMAQRFDAGRETLVGEAVPVASRVKYHAGGDLAADVSSNGALVYRPLEGVATTRLVLYDRRGRELRALAPDASYRHPRFSPDGRLVAVARADADSPDPDIWVYDLARQGAARLTTHRAPDVNPVWSPDGRRIVFSSKRAEYYDLYAKAVNGTQDEQPVLASEGDKYAEHWSPDGRVLSGVVQRYGLWILPMTGDRKPWQFRAPVSGDPLHSAFSPDGRWLAYTSIESGAPEVYVEPFPSTGERWQVSARGGAEPHWRGDGREMFYLAPDGALMAVDLRAGPSFRAGSPHPLFLVAVPDLLGSADYTVSPDGQQFVVNTIVGDPLVPPLHVVVNWTRLLPP